MNKNSKKPTISVVLPVYNAGKYLRSCLDSILNQTYKDFEVIALNDGSKDNSQAILDEYAKNDTRIKVYTNEKNLGVSMTANKAVKLAAGDYIARMDADDIMYPTRLEEQLAFLQEHEDHILVGAQVRIVDRNGQFLRFKLFPTKHDEMYKLLYTAMPVQQPSIMVNRKKLPKDFVWYVNGMNTAEEVELIFKLVKYGKIANLDRIQLDYRDHEDSLSRQNPKDTFRLTYIARKRGVKLHGYRPTLKDYATVELQRMAVTILPNKVIYPVYFLVRKLILFVSSNHTKKAFVS